MPVVSRPSVSHREYSRLPVPYDAQLIERAGMTPTSVGPRPRNSASGPSVRYMSLCGRQRHFRHISTLVRSLPNRDRREMTDLMITPVSAKCHRSLRTPCRLAELAVGAVRWNVVDCNRVLTRSKGAVATAPHKPPILLH